MQRAPKFQTGSIRRMSAFVLTLLALLAGPASAQAPADWSYEVGLRSTLMLSPMALADLGGGFADLPAGAKALPHSSSLFILWPLGTHVRVGIETLVGSSYPGSDTDILFQGTGVTAEYQTTGTWFAAFGLQAGAMIASASQSSELEAPLRPGVHYKQSGYFLAPQLSVGRRVGRFDLRVIGKPVWHFGGDGLDAFDSFYLGISAGRVNG